MTRAPTGDNSRVGFVIVVLGVAIAVALVIASFDLVTRPARRARIRHEEERRRAVEDEPVPGLARVAADAGWEGPLGEDPIEDSRARRTIARLTLGVNQHRAFPQNGNISDQAFPVTAGLDLQRFVHAHTGTAHSRRFMLANAVTVVTPSFESTYDGPIAGAEHLTAAVCQLALPRFYPELAVGQVSRRRSARDATGITASGAADGHVAFGVEPVGVLDRVDGRAS
jgi:hypothetical protein